jgi:hypothetical protein
LVIVSPATVLRWQRRRFCEHWTKLSARPLAGRPPVNAGSKFHRLRLRNFFTVPTARLRVLFVLVVLAHHRRRVVHFNVTEHPTAHWTAQQIVDAFPDDSAQSYLLATVTRSTANSFGTE